MHKKMKVIVCDDSSVNRDLMGSYLKKMGHEPLYAENGMEAVRLFTTEQPDLVLMDVEMPEMDGYEATQKIREACDEFSQWIPVIFTSGHVDDESIVKGIDAGGDDYLTKPISLPVLKAKVHAMTRLAVMRQRLIDFAEQLRYTNEKLQSANQMLSELSLKDPLTKLGNRRFFEESLQRAGGVAQRENKPLSLMMIDVDNFKHFNDTYGHQAGDRLLQQIATVFKRGLHRASDMSARYGGEEFSIILLDTPLSGALQVAERLRLGVEAYQVPNEVKKGDVVTISIGVATANPRTKYELSALVQAADAALYEAKESGRNCVVAAKLPVGESIFKKSSSGKKSDFFPPDHSNSKH